MDAEVSVAAVVVIAVAAAEVEEASAEEVAAAVVVTVVAVAVEEGELQEVAELPEVAVEAAEEVEVAPKLLLLNLIATTEFLLHVVKKMLWLPLIWCLAKVFMVKNVFPLKLKDPTKAKLNIVFGILSDLSWPLQFLEVLTRFICHLAAKSCILVLHLALAFHMFLTLLDQ